MSGITADGIDALGNNPFQVVIGITGNWDMDDNSSSPGAKLYIRTYPAGKIFALARAAALLNGEDFDEMPHSLVVYGHQKRSWGIARTPAAKMAQTKHVHEDMGLDLHW